MGQSRVIDYSCTVPQCLLDVDGPKWSGEAIEYGRKAQELQKGYKYVGGAQLRAGHWFLG